MKACGDRQGDKTRRVTMEGVSENQAEFDTDANHAQVDLGRGQRV